MAKNENGYDREQSGNIEIPDGTTGGSNELRDHLSKEFDTCQRAIKYFALDWDLYEDAFMVQSRTADNLHVRVSDGQLSSIMVERAARNNAQNPTGTVRALGLAKTGQSLLYQLLLFNKIIPNDDEQYDHDIKMFLWALYADMYGTMGMQYDVSLRGDGLPVSWLVPIRNLWPQQGRFSVKNSDYMYVSNFLSRNDLQSILDNNIEDYDLECVDQILTQTKDKAVAPRSTNDYLRHNPMWQYRRRAQFYDTGQFEVVTKYEAGISEDDPGRWISFFCDYDNKVMRNIENPLHNRRIPIVLRYALPTLDSIIGLGAAEKGLLMQNAADMVLNMQIDGLKIHTYPPRKIIMQNVNIPTIRMQPAAKWGVSNMNDEGPIELPEIDQSKNMTYQFIQNALNNINGKSSMPLATNQSQLNAQPKSPAAIQDKNESENTMDALYLKFQQKAQAELYEGMLSILCASASDDDAEPIEIQLFENEIKQILDEGYDDIKDIVTWPGKGKKDGGVQIEDAKTIILKIPPSKLKNDYGLKFDIDEGSTLQEDQDKQFEAINGVYEDYVDNAAAIETLLNQGGKTVDFPELYKQRLINSGIKQWNDILKPTSQGSQPGQAGANAGQTGQVVAQQAQQANQPPDAQAGLSQPNLTTAGVGVAPVAPNPQINPGFPSAGPTQAPVQAITPAEMPDENYMIQDPEIRQAHAQMMAIGGQR